MMDKTREPSLLESLIPIFGAIIFLFIGIVILGLPVQIPLIFSTILAGISARVVGHPWQEIENGLIKGIIVAMQANVILLIVGTVIGSWLISGTISAMIYYGLDLISPVWFLAATCVVCSIVSLAIGSSWTTAATVGIALIGIGTALGIPAPMCAGAVLSGSYFGDKMSPMSDTTNLAPGVAGSNLFDHINAMLYTTMPAWFISVILFTGIGFFVIDTSNFDPHDILALQNDLKNIQNISPWLFIPPLVVIALAVKRFPAIPTLLTGTFLGIIAALIFQHNSFTEILTATYSGFEINSSNEALNSLLSRGGMTSFLETILLIFCATAFGGILESGGFMRVILRWLLSKVKSDRGLVALTVCSSIGTNFLLADQYLSIVLPGRMYRNAYPQRGLQPKMLSRSLEDGGTVTSCLCPWNSGGAYMAATLGVPTLSYLPFAFLNLLVPTIAILYTIFNLFIFRENDQTKQRTA